MNPRTRSWILAVFVGVELGAFTLLARYAPWPGGSSQRQGNRGGKGPVAEALDRGRSSDIADGGSRTSDSADGGSSSITAGPASDDPHPGRSVAAAAGGPLASRPLPSSRAERFAADPIASAACPPEMTLVEGEFCPELAYSCIRRPREAAYRCAEYARGARCLGELDHRRFCVDRWEWPNRVGENPLVYVDWNEAKALCADAGKRLCRRSEWILACEGPKRLPFPWGFVRQPTPCNIDRATIPFDVEAMIDETTREGELARLWQADRIGSHPDCVSAFGAYDLSGNVDEWTDDLADNPSSKHPSTLNGGYWGPVRNTCRLTTTSHGPSFKFYQVGFRCCADTIDGVPVAPPRPFIEREEREPKKDTDTPD